MGTQFAVKKITVKKDLDIIFFAWYASNQKYPFLKDNFKEA